MASEVIAFPVNLRKNKNQYSTAYGKYFPKTDTKEPLKNIVSCLKEMAIQGQPVKLTDFRASFLLLKTIPYEATADTSYTVEWLQLTDCETDYGNDTHEHPLYQWIYFCHNFYFLIFISDAKLWRFGARNNIFSVFRHGYMRWIYDFCNK